MKKYKYIPGDLVMVNHESVGTPDGRVYVIKSAEPDFESPQGNGEYLVGSYILKPIDSVVWRVRTFGKYIVPIKLTTDILSKNGWKQTKHVVDKDGYEYYLYENDNRMLPEVEFYPKTDYRSEESFSAFWGDTEIRPEICYLHELQNLIFGLDIEFEFKL